MRPSQAFLRELPDIAPTPTVLILDDYHVADGSGDVSYVAKSLITKAPERLYDRHLKPTSGPKSRSGDFERKVSSPSSEPATSSSPKTRSPTSSQSNSARRSTASRSAFSTAARRAGPRRCSWFAPQFATGHSDEVRDFIRRPVRRAGRALRLPSRGSGRRSPPAHQEFLMRTSILQVVTVAGASAICGDSIAEAHSFVDAVRATWTDLATGQRVGRLPLPPSWFASSWRPGFARQSATTGIKSFTRGLASGPTPSTGELRVTTSRRPANIACCPSSPRLCHRQHRGPGRIRDCGGLPATLQAQP